MLDADTLAPAASAVPRAKSVTRVIMPGTLANPNTPIRNTRITEAVALSASRPNAVRVTVRPSRARTSARSRSWSAARPPTRFPTTRPTPYTMSNQATSSEEKPLTSVKVWVM